MVSGKLCSLNKICFKVQLLIKKSYFRSLNLYFLQKHLRHIIIISKQEKDKEKKIQISLTSKKKNANQL